MPRLLEPPEAPSPWLEFFPSSACPGCESSTRWKPHGNGDRMKNQEECRETART